MNQFYVLTYLIQKRPGVSELELMRAIHGDEDWHLQEIDQDCRMLLACGKVDRRGSGLPGDPYRYWPAPGSVRLPRSGRRKKRVRRRKGKRPAAGAITGSTEGVG